MISDPVWPASLPAEPEMDGYQETVVSSSAVYQPGVAGTPSMWLRSMFPGKKTSARFLMTDDQKATFLDFYNNTLTNGAGAFSWANPAYSYNSERYIFDPASPPQISAKGFGLWDVAVAIIRAG